MVETVRNMSTEMSEEATGCFVVVVAYHGERWIASCLDTLAESVRHSDRLCLVDNSGNGDSIPDAYPACPYLVLNTPRPLGFAEANNYALRHGGVDEEAICFLNQDTISVPGWVEACLDCLRADSSIGAIAPLLRNYDDNGWDPNFLACSKASQELSGSLGDGEFLRDFYELPNVTAAALIVRTEVLQEVGPFDPVYGSYYEDYDLCLRIRRAGYRVGVCGNASVRHFSGSSTTTPAAERKRMRQVLRNRAIYNFREMGSRRLSAIASYFGATVPRNLLRGLLRTPSSQPVGVQVSAIADLVRDLPRFASERADSLAWRSYLDELGWPSNDRVAHAGSLERPDSKVDC